MRALRITLVVLGLISVSAAIAFWQRYQIAWNLLWILKPSQAFHEVVPKPNYGRAADWAIRSLPDGTKASVFYVHPTSYLTGETWNQPLAAGYEDEFLLQNLMPPQVAPFSDHAVYAPHYRQSIIYGLQLIDPGPQAIDLAREGVASAFEEFLKSAPTDTIVIVGHSQGALLLSGLLHELRSRPEVMRRIAVAYLIGWAVPEASLNGVIPMGVCRGESDTGCLISYNARDAGDYYIPRLVRHAINVTDGGYRELENEPIVCWSPVRADSAVSGDCAADGWLEIKTPPEDHFDFLMSKGWYHTVEIPLFADELRSDASGRVEAHLEATSFAHQ